MAFNLGFEEKPTSNALIEAVKNLSLNLPATRYPYLNIKSWAWLEDRVPPVGSRFWHIFKDIDIGDANDIKVLHGHNYHDPCRTTDFCHREDFDPTQYSVAFQRFFNQKWKPQQELTLRLE